MFCSVPTECVIENYKKIAKKNKKIKKYHYGFFPAKFVGKCRDREKIKFIDPFRSFPKGKRKFQKNSKNIQKIKKKTIMSSFHGKIGRGRLRKRENKNCRSIQFLAEGLEKIPQN